MGVWVRQSHTRHADCWQTSAGDMTAALFTCCRPEAHDDVIKWKHFPRYWPFVRGIHRSRSHSQHNVGTPLNMHPQACVVMIVTYALVPNRLQDIVGMMSYELHYLCIWNRVTAIKLYSRDVDNPSFFSLTSPSSHSGNNALCREGGDPSDMARFQQVKVAPASQVFYMFYCASEAYPIVTTSWWRHQMEAFYVLLTLCAGYSSVTGEFPSQEGQ